MCTLHCSNPARLTMASCVLVTWKFRTLYMGHVLHQDQQQIQIWQLCM
jgi:hypothetical protein